MVNHKAILYGILGSLGLLIFYISVVSIFQGVSFAFLNLRMLWYLLFPLAMGFGVQVGLYVAIKHTAKLTATVATTGTLSGGSMVACCSHFILTFLPIAGASSIASFVTKYQAVFLVFGILSNLIGISIMIKHFRKIKRRLCHE